MCEGTLGLALGSNSPLLEDTDLHDMTRSCHYLQLLSHCHFGYAVIFTFRNIPVFFSQDSRAFWKLRRHTPKHGATRVIVKSPICTFLTAS